MPLSLPLRTPILTDEDPLLYPFSLNEFLKSPVPKYSHVED